MANVIKRKMIDIGANLTDAMFQGIYFGKSYHLPDVGSVLQRATENDVDKIIVTGGTLEDSQKAVELAKQEEYLYATVGCHPTRCSEMEPQPEAYLDKLLGLWQENRDKVVALGELGLDYARLHFCSKDIQIKNFTLQLELAKKTKLPLFLHCRESEDDLLQILTKHRDEFSTGVVHSFTGTYEEAKSFLDLGLYIGINGCSLKTEENLEVVRKLPIDRLMIETDSPYCEIKPTHASEKYVQTKFLAMKKEKWSEWCHVKGRCEPANLVQVLEVIGKLREDVDLDHLSQTIYDNTVRVFFPSN